MRMFLACDYYATGEGATKCLMIQSFNAYNDKTLEEQAFEAFCNRFDPYFARGMEILTEEEFFYRYRQYMPDVVWNLYNDKQAHFAWSTMLHVNYS